MEHRPGSRSQLTARAFHHQRRGIGNAFETREGQGGLFKNARKEKPAHPDYQGELRIGGTLYRISAWIKESQRGTRWMSLSIKPDERESAGSPPTPAASPARSGQASKQGSGGSYEFNDEIPF